MVGYAQMLRFVVRCAGNGANPPYELHCRILSSIIINDSINPTIRDIYRSIAGHIAADADLEQDIGAHGARRVALVAHFETFLSRIQRSLRAAMSGGTT
jgi:hypothetical protein